MHQPYQRFCRYGRNLLLPDKQFYPGWRRTRRPWSCWHTRTSRPVACQAHHLRFSIRPGQVGGKQLVAEYHNSRSVRGDLHSSVRSCWYSIWSESYNFPSGYHSFGEGLLVQHLGRVFQLSQCLGLLTPANSLPRQGYAGPASRLVLQFSQALGFEHVRIHSFGGDMIPYSH